MTKYRIQCTVSGIWNAINTQWINRIEAKYGSVDEFRKIYVCRDAKRLLKEGKTEAEIRKMAEDGTLSSKIRPPKGAKKKKSKAKRKKKENSVQTGEQESVDPEVEEFLKAS